MKKMTQNAAGHKIASIGASIYRVADELPELEIDEDYNQIMHLINKLAFRLINGRERDSE
jgi:hypothetical protein